MKKAYLDANILISYLAGPAKEPLEYPKAKGVFDEIKTGKYYGVISTLTLMEILGVIRLIYGSDLEHLKTIESKKRAEYVIAQSSKTYSELVKELMEMPNVLFEKGKQSNLQTITDVAFDIMSNLKGDVKIYDKCKKCGSDLEFSTFKGVATIDILHALTAKDVGCDILITFDKAFNDIRDNEKIQPLEIIIL